MLLRRITKHVKDQNWFAVFLDFFIVVAGILIAFQITEWNEGRQEWLDAERFLERLDQDFAQQQERTNAAMAGHTQYLQATARLIEGVRTGVFDQGSLAYDIRIATLIYAPPSPSIAFQELVASGRTELIRDEALRNALYEYNNYVSFLRSRYDHFSGPTQEARNALLSAQTRTTTGIPSAGFEDLGRTQNVDSTVLLNNPNIYAALQHNYFSHDNLLLVFRGVGGRIDEIQTLIDAAKEEAR